jgi:prolyl 4-hydroxylase
MGQRFMTCMIYLNNIEAGGGTEFANLGHTFEGKAGRLLIWNNLDGDGNPNHATLHHGLPVEKGYKAVITKWFRQNGEGEKFTKEANENLPAYEPTGFKKLRIPKPLFGEIQNFYEENQSQFVEEVVEGFISGVGDSGSALLPLPLEISDNIHKNLQPQLEKWCGVKLEPTFVYGIRKYGRGARLKVHRDRIETHIISAILNIDQDVDEDWALHIDDHFYRQHKLNLIPGEMIFYEGGKLSHGRPEPLKGNYYSNIFVHYKPA